jgi:hypothetical protein
MRQKRVPNRKPVEEPTTHIPVWKPVVEEVVLRKRAPRTPVAPKVEAVIPTVEVVQELPKPAPMPRPKRTPRTPVAPKVEPVLIHVPEAEIEAIIMTPIELRKLAIQRIFPHVPLEDIFIDKGNGVELFRLPGSFTYASRAPLKEGEGITMNTDTKTFNEWVKTLGYAWAPGRENIVKGYMTQNKALDMIQRYTGDGSLQYKGGS